MSTELGQSRRIDDVRSGVAVRDQAGDRVVEVAGGIQVVLGSGSQHESSARRLGRDPDPLRRGAGVVDPPGLRVVVLDRAAGRARIGEHPNGLGDAAGVVGVETFAVHVQRQRRRGGELGDVRDELVAHHGLVGLADREREARTRRRQRLEPERGEDLRRPDVPRVRQEEELVTRVELAETVEARHGCSSIIVTVRQGIASAARRG